MTNWIRMRREAKLATVGCCLALTLLGCATTRSLPPIRTQSATLQSACLAERLAATPSADLPPPSAAELAMQADAQEQAAASDTDEHEAAKLAVSGDADANAASGDVLVSDFGGRR